MGIYSRYCNVSLLVLLSLSVLNSCAQAQSDSDIEKMLSQLDNGKVVGNVYENKLLNLKMRFPKEMAPDSEADVASNVKEGIEMLWKERDQRRIDEMIRKERIVFTLDLPESEDSIGAAMSLTIKKDETKEELRLLVDRSIKFFTGDGKQRLIVSPKEESVGVIKAITFSMSMDVEGGTVFSKIYCTRRNGYLLTFSLSYLDEKGLTQMDAVLKGIEAIESPK